MKMRSVYVLFSIGIFLSASVFAGSPKKEYRLRCVKNQRSVSTSPTNSQGNQVKPADADPSEATGKGKVFPQRGTPILNFK